jgi:hypothetical protein
VQLLPPHPPPDTVYFYCALCLELHDPLGRDGEER